MSIKKLLLIFAFIFSIFSSTAGAMMEDLFEKEERKVCKNKSNIECSNFCESEKNNCTITKKENDQDERKRNNIWYAGGCCQGSCTQVSSLSANQGKFDEEISGFELFGSSFFRGAAYSLIPEVFRDALDSKGYYQTSNVVTTIIQGGMIYYNSSYVPAITGIVARTGCNKLGFSDQVSTNVGVTLAIAASLSQKLIFSQETMLDSIIDVTVGVSGSFSGSYLALKAKSWVYKVWENKDSSKYLK
ncbi:MAG: hypothetical protein K2P93_03375 [Alphaproteobacteria bacterium]|jgi:hypothetical protein|nr:hypothetical protein [Alphaproteobacteria bacterium]